MAIDPAPAPWATPSAPKNAVPVSETSRPSKYKHVDGHLVLGHTEPLQYGGSLDQFKSFEVTPGLGTEFSDARLSEWLQAPESDQLIRDLAITASRRGVVFFRAQNDMSSAQMKELVQRLGLLGGKPSQNGLHIFPVQHTEKQLGDKEITVITHEDNRVAGKIPLRIQDPTVTPASDMWHSDLGFEPVPCDYGLLSMTTLPRTGGDTIWASGYTVYDRLSKPMKEFLSGLTFTATQKTRYDAIVAAHNLSYYEDARGAPENHGSQITATHPMIRTNPVTGWNTVFGLGHHAKQINGLSQPESRTILDLLNNMLITQHDNHCRFRWQNEFDIAIWDNRSTVHTATPDYIDKGLGDRRGRRILSVGERPYLDPDATGQHEAEAVLNRVILK